MKHAIATFAALLVSACTMLSAPEPLFTAADNDATFAAPEGLWAIKGPDCKANPARSRPGRTSCLDWLRVGRAEGAWALIPAEENEDGAARLIVTAAAPRRAIDGPAPLYVGEGVETPQGTIAYYAIVPRGPPERPFDRLAVTGVECFVTYGDWGEIEGVVVEREDGKVVRCIAQSKEGVREAARRAAIAALPTLSESELVFVRP